MSEKVLKEIADILFPPLEFHDQGEDKIYVDRSITENLDSVLSDLNSGLVDQVSIKTLETYLAKLYRVEDLLSEYRKKAELKESGLYMLGL